jgi:hypothetical protein
MRWERVASQLHKYGIHATRYQAVHGAELDSEYMQALLNQVAVAVHSVTTVLSLRQKAQGCLGRNDLRHSCLRSLTISNIFSKISYECKVS